jgi:hypothetical protein
LKFIKVVEIACVQFFGFTEGDNFSSMKFMKNKLKKLLDLPFGSMHSFLCTKVLKHSKYHV